MICKKLSKFCKILSLKNGDDSGVAFRFKIKNLLFCFLEGKFSVDLSFLFSDFCFDQLQ